MLAGKSVVVTGAGSGIGRVLALRLASHNAEVWAADIQAESLAELVDDAEKFGHKIHAHQVDVCDREAMGRLRDAVLAQRSSLDFWVNNAGIAHLVPFKEATPEEFDRVLDVNLKGVVYGTRVALEAMESAGSGTIVNMASVAGHLPAPLMTSYNASKFAVVGFTRSLAAELKLRDSPVKTLLVSPGFVDTKILKKGEKNGFPHWLAFLLTSPERVADDILRAMTTGKREIYPTLNGKLMRRMYGMFPGMTVTSSKALLAKSWKDFLMNRYDTSDQA